MEKTIRLIAAACAACMLALCVGCSSGTASSSASASASGEAAPAASASAESAQSSASEGAARSSAVSELPTDLASLPDGEYQIDVALEGGTGKAYIESPAKLTVDGGEAELTVVWSSENYDLMIVDGQELYPVPRPGNSTFQVPVSSIAEDLPVQGETTAMSQPHLIDYVIHFDPATLSQL